MTEAYIARTLQAYDSHPEQYQISTEAMAPQPELQAFMNLLPTGDAPILDAGCAFGRDMAVFSEQGLQPIGIDMSEGLLARGRALYPEFSFAKMDVRNLNFPDNHFAGIWCHAVLLHLNNNDIKRALREFYRVLLPEGVLAVSFKEGEGSEEIVEKFSSDDARFYNYQNLPRVAAWLRAADFHIQRGYVVNERERFGADKRDLNWIYCFAAKPA